VCQAVLESVLPKLVPSDLASFESLLRKAFPEFSNVSLETAAVGYALRAVCARKMLIWQASHGDGASQGNMLRSM
jgi:hypothetical protein